MVIKPVIWGQYKDKTKEFISFPKQQYVEDRISSLDKDI